MSDLACPRCGIAGVTVPAERGTCTDYKCGCCGLAFGISEKDRRRVRASHPARLVEASTRNRLWQFALSACEVLALVGYTGGLCALIYFTT